MNLCLFNPQQPAHTCLTRILGLILWLVLTSMATAGSLALIDAEVLFDDKSGVQLTEEGQQSFDTLTRTLQGLDGILSIRVIGHTDNLGDEQDNQTLSLQRANWVKRRLQHQFPGTHILSMGAGESIPYAHNENATGRSRNQRVQIQVIATGLPPGSD